MRILIIKLSALGDVVHALPVLDFIRQVAPQARVDWAVEAGNAPVLENNPFLATLIPLPLKRWKKNLHDPKIWAEIRQAISGLRRGGYDLSIDLQGNIKSGLVALCAAAPVRVGFDRQGVRERPNLWVNNRHIDLRPEDYPVSARSLRLVSAALGGDYQGMELATEIVTSADDDAVARSCIQEGAPRVLIHTGTTWPTKRWSGEGWQQLVAQLKAVYPDIRLLFSWGNPVEEEEARQLAVQVGQQGTLLPRLTVKQFCALLKQVDLVIGGDTGPVHLAAAVGTKTVSFYRATDPLRNGPRGARHRQVATEMACAGCLKRSCTDDAVCRAAVTPEALLQAVRELLA